MTGVGMGVGLGDGVGDGSTLGDALMSPDPLGPTATGLAVAAPDGLVDAAGDAKRRPVATAPMPTTARMATMSETAARLPTRRLTSVRRASDRRARGRDGIRRHGWRPLVGAVPAGVRSADDAEDSGSAARRMGVELRIAVGWPWTRPPPLSPGRIEVSRMPDRQANGDRPEGATKASAAKSAAAKTPAARTPATVARTTKTAANGAKPTAKAATTVKTAAKKATAKPPTNTAAASRSARAAAAAKAPAATGVVIDPPGRKNGKALVVPTLDTVTVARGALGSVEAREIVVTQGAIGAARATTVNIEMGALGAALAGEVSVTQGFARTVVAREVHLDQALAQSILADRVTMKAGSAALIIIARRVDGQVRALLDWRGALALGAGIGAVVALFRPRGRRR